jgi:hypothetical protein
MRGTDVSTVARLRRHLHDCRGCRMFDGRRRVDLGSTIDTGRLVDRPGGQ